MTQTTIRVSTETRDRLNGVAAVDFAGVSSEEAIQKLLDEHWMVKCIAAADRYRAEDPEGFAADLAESDEWEAAAGPVLDTIPAEQTA